MGDLKNMLEISDGRAICTTATVVRALATASTPVRYIIITAETDNTGVVVVGGTDVLATLSTRKGTPLLAGDSLTLEMGNLADVYIDTTVAGDGVTFVTLK